MKIALFTDTYHPQTNGVVSYIDDSVKVLTRENEVVLFAPGSGHFRVEQVSPNFRIHWIPSAPFPFYEGYRIASINYKRVSNILRDENPDIVHAHAPVILGLQGLIAARRKGIPVVVTYHTHFPDYMPHLMNGRLPGALTKISEFTVKKLIRHSFARADVVTAPTNELVEELRSYGLRNVVHIPNGVDLSKLKADGRKIAAFRRRHGLGPGKKVVLYLGRVSFEKRLDVLLKAFRMMGLRNRVLVIAGSGPYMKEFRQLAADLRLRNVVFTGFLDQEDVAAAYRSADIFASASDTETFGLTFVEAMHAGIPVIGVNRLGAKEVVKDGKNGLLVEPGDSGKLARAMERLLRNVELRRRMGRAARQMALEYSIENSVRKTTAIYNLLRKR